MVQDGKYYNHRPTFYCRENDYCMFFDSELKQWCIFWRVSPKYASCRLKTPRGPHMASGETWSVWNNEKKKFVKSTEMVCRLLTPDELVALAPDTIMMNAEQLGHCWHEAPGAIASQRRDAAGLANECFKKIDKMMNGRPVYQSWREKNQRPVLTADPVASFQTNSVVTCFKGSERVGSCHRFSDRYLIYHSKKKIWTLAFSTEEEDKEWYLRSAPTDCYSPLVAPWVDGKDMRYRPTLPHELDMNGYPETRGGKKTMYREVGLPGLSVAIFKIQDAQDAHNMKLVAV